MNLAIDFHSHILPGIDDGSASVAESIEMLRLEAEQGITHVVATPHFYAQNDMPERFLERRAQAAWELREEMVKHSGLPEISVGAEVYFFRGMSDSDLAPLTFGENRCILIEMPHAPWSDEIYRELEAIWVKQGLIPVIAHIDRYIGPFRTHRIPQRLGELPVFVQANADFFLDGLTSGMAMRLLKADQIQLLGSDCHNLSSRKPNLGPALRCIEQKLGREALERVHSYESMLLCGNQTLGDRME